MDTSDSNKHHLLTCATCLRHLIVWISEQRPKAFEDYRLYQLMRLYRNPTAKIFTAQFGIRGGRAAYILYTQRDQHNSIAEQILDDSSDSVFFRERADHYGATDMLSPLFTILGWPLADMYVALRTLYLYSPRTNGYK